MVTAIDVDQPSVEVDTEPSPNLLSVSATVPATPTQMRSVNSLGRELETPPSVSIILRSPPSMLMTVHLLALALLADVSTLHRFNASLPRCSQCLHATCYD